MEESKIKKVLAILLAILFVVSLTAVAVEAQRGHGGFGMTTTSAVVTSARGGQGGTGHVFGSGAGGDAYGESAVGGIGGHRFGTVYGEIRPM
jgi:hypothetical protein